MSWTTPGGALNRTDPLVILYSGPSRTTPTGQRMLGKKTRLSTDQPHNRFPMHVAALVLI